MTSTIGWLVMVSKTEEQYVEEEIFAALNKTWTRIGMGKIALANSLVGRPLFAPEEVDLLINALIPNEEEKTCHPTSVGLTGS
ncbi:MAG: hypothetical protein ACFFB3_07655 [Candidatus Hodarchaeota archaeon]